MLWGAHKWFLAGMVVSGIITVLLALIVQSFGAAVAVIVAYVVVSSVVLYMFYRRRGDRSIAWRSRELRCKWPTDVSMRFHRVSPPVTRRAAMLLAMD
jgi:hypothetical protein